MASSSEIVFFFSSQSRNFQRCLVFLINSCKRDLSSGKIKGPVYSGYSVWRSILPTNQKNINFHLGANFHIVTYPIGMNQSSFVAAIKTKTELNESWRQKGDYDDLRSELPSSIIDEFPSLKQSNQIYKWGVFTRPLPNELFNKNYLTSLFLSIIF